MLIGLASALSVLLLGRIAGISGILRHLLLRPNADTAWRFSFILGMLLAPQVYLRFFPAPDISLNPHVLLLISAGLLVGYGTAQAGGCTSGHGVSGLARGSRRSLLAVFILMLSAMLTVAGLHLFTGDLSY